MFNKPPSFDAKAFREMQEILPGLYLGGSQPTESKAYMKTQGITHILQVADMWTPQYPADFTYEIIPVQDTDQTNLIKYFPDTYSFINGALESGGKVFVHCQAGSSRSATVVCAYLMRSMNLSATDALSTVQALRPVADPNDGFMEQLILYGDIDFDVSTDRAEYRRYLIFTMAAQRKIYGCIKDMKLAADPAAATPSSSPSSPSSPSSTTAAATLPQHPLECKKCQRVLVAHHSVIPHTPGQRQNVVQYRKRDNTAVQVQVQVSEGALSDNDDDDDDDSKNNNNEISQQSDHPTACHSYFIEPLEWIQGLDENDGIIVCPKCDEDLGTFNWLGDQCSCGARASPAFILHKEKVDA